MMDWFAVHTKNRHERVVHQCLNQKGFSVFLPEKVEWSRRRDRRKQISVPLFPGYLFLCPQVQATWQYEVNVVPGVVRVLGPHGSPSPVSEQEITILRLLVESGEELESLPYIVPGDAVRIEAGPLTGAEGVVVRRGRKAHLVVSIELLQRSVSVELTEGQLGKI